MSLSSHMLPSISPHLASSLLLPLSSLLLWGQFDRSPSLPPISCGIFPTIYIHTWPSSPPPAIPLHSGKQQQCPHPPFHPATFLLLSQSPLGGILYLYQSLFTYTSTYLHLPTYSAVLAVVLLLLLAVVVSAPTHCPLPPQPLPLLTDHRLLLLLALLMMRMRMRLYLAIM